MRSDTNPQELLRYPLVGMCLSDAIRMFGISLTVVNVIETTVRVLLIVYNQGSTQAITILGLEMAMVPERPLKIASNFKPWK
jgi:hypothetical protein